MWQTSLDEDQWIPVLVKIIKVTEENKRLDSNVLQELLGYTLRKYHFAWLEIKNLKKYDRSFATI